jgi:hypothetical protein
MKKIDIVINNNKQLDVWFNDSLIGCPALPLLLSTQSEIMKKGYAPFNLALRNNSSIVWIQDQDIVMGGICFEYIIERKESWINLSFTDEQFRGQGINQLCHTYFENISREKGALSIGSVVSTENISRLKSALKVGLKPKFYRMSKDL